MPPPFLLSDDERRAPRALVEQGLRLLGRMHHGDANAAERARQQWQQWCQASPAQAEAAHTAEKIWQASAADHGLRDALRTKLPLPPTAAAQQQTRRRLVGSLCVLGLITAGGAGGRWYWRQPVYEQLLSTGHAQTLEYQLPDGTALQLGARSSLTATLWRHQRQVHMRQGEVRFTVAHDSERPFTIETDWGRVRVLGTVFTVSLQQGRMRVAVEEGRVAVWSSASPGLDQAPDLVLGAGEWAQTDSQGVMDQGHADAADMGDWTRGWLVFRDTPLDEAVARWNAYLRIPLRLSGAPADRDGTPLRLTGSYRLADPQAFVASLPQMLPVRTERQADGTIRIEPR